MSFDRSGTFNLAHLRACVITEPFHDEMNTTTEVSSIQTSLEGDWASRIESLAAKIQALPPGLRWVHAQEDLIYAQATGKSAFRGVWTQRANRLMAAARLLHLDLAVSALINLLLLLKLCLAQRQRKTAAPAAAPLFVGFGAMREQSLQREFETMAGAPCLRVNETDLRSFSDLQSVPMKSLIREWASTWHYLWKNSCRLGAVDGLSRNDCMSQLLRFGHAYIYLRAWFRRWLSTSRRPIAFIVPGLPAAAAVSLGARAIYLNHGLQIRSVVFPDFARVRALTRWDAEHFRKRIPGCEIEVLQFKRALIESRRVAVIAGDYATPDFGWKEFEMSRSFIEWARQHDIPVIVRRHARDDTGYWEQWHGAKGVTVLEPDMAFEPFLEEMCPRAVVAWTSTALVDALARGCVTVTLMPDGPMIRNYAFPFREMCVRWPDQQDLLARLFDDAVLRKDFVAKKIAKLA